ncbi:hypothetical protein CKAN_00064400 [Cinnamomum micranthum f. kanehirae]|uniref:Uncharacterized protein n=1 Tax=Cinnamomum micranthum f. kanehirae TaxID=337451 RepID=A0A3S3MPD8_9MAGN|nr:hypothetical protein CKAN_00064400 [Cinnamomum micranthum f. kanehirae]
MPSLLSSEAMVLATAMAVSGTIILFLCKQEPFSASQLVLGQNPTPPSLNLRSCISSEEKRRGKKKKRVRFADDVVEPIRREEEITRVDRDGEVLPRMPANRMVLYNGKMQDRLQRLQCSY